MTWEANEVALVISTTATALTAISGVLLPFWRDFLSKRHARREDLYRRLSEAIYFCVENIGTIADRAASNSMRLAFFNAGMVAPEPDTKLEDVNRQFNQRRAITEFLLFELELDGKAYFQAIATVLLASPRFFVQHGKLVRDEKDAQQKMREQVDAMSRVAAEGAALLKAARQKLKADY